MCGVSDCALPCQARACTLSITHSDYPAVCCCGMCVAAGTTAHGIHLPTTPTTPPLFSASASAPPAYPPEDQTPFTLPLSDRSRPTPKLMLPADSQPLPPPPPPQQQAATEVAQQDGPLLQPQEQPGAEQPEQSVPALLQPPELQPKLQHPGLSREEVMQRLMQQQLRAQQQPPTVPFILPLPQLAPEQPQAYEQQQEQQLQALLPPGQVRDRWEVDPLEHSQRQSQPRPPLHPSVAHVACSDRMSISEYAHSDRPSPEDMVVVCSVCEELWPTWRLEEHSELCAVLRQVRVQLGRKHASAECGVWSLHTCLLPLMNQGIMTGLFLPRTSLSCSCA